MKRLFVAGLLFVFMAVMPLFHAVADNNQTCNGRIENYVSATGTVARNGTPTPDNPIEPTFYQQGNMILRKVGNYADSYDATTRKITRRVGMKVLDGTENTAIRYGMFQVNAKLPVEKNSGWQARRLCSHGVAGSASATNNVIEVDGSIIWFGGEFITDMGWTTAEDGKAWIVQQYANGTPVVVYYPLATPVEEDWPSSYCQPTIKIATTAYNAARFNPVKTDLNNAVATIREIVTKTINQTAAIASLQADKQTRPEDACPAGKKCLLVETEENGVIVPHWFPIIEDVD